MTSLIVFVGMFGTLALGAIWNGFALSLLWGWLIVPTFSLPALTTTPAIGVALVVNFLTSQRLPKQREMNQAEQMLESLVYMALKPAMAIGWIVKQWM